VAVGDINEYEEREAAQKKKTGRTKKTVGTPAAQSYLLPFSTSLLAGCKIGHSQLLRKLKGYCCQFL
jgi:hypothetical protein